MRLLVQRFSSQNDSTNGLLFEITDDGVRFLCYTLEDERRDEKIMGETRIPDGTYKIKLRKEGGFHQRYTKKYGKMHKGMLHVTEVHTGNTDEHTAGCLLVGDSQENNTVIKDGFVGKSNNAYKRIYPDIAAAIERGEEVTITYTDINGVR